MTDKVYLSATPQSVCGATLRNQVVFLGVGTCTIVPKSTGTAAFEAATGTPVVIPVAPARTTLTASSQVIVSGSSPSAVRYTYTAYGNGLSSSSSAGLATRPSCTTTATAASTLGVYPAVCSGAADPNYTITYVAGTVKVVGAMLDVDPPVSGNFSYGDPLPPLVPVYRGLRNGDAGPAVPPTCVVYRNSSGSALTTIPSTLPAVGFYIFYPACSGGSDPFYELRYGNGFGNSTTGTDRAVWTITSAVVTLSAPSPTIAYGDPVPALVPTVSGLKNNDTPDSLGITCRVDDPRPLTVGTHYVLCQAPYPQPNGNYNFGVGYGTLTVTPRGASVTASSQTVAYGTSPAPVTPSYTGLAGDDTAPATAPTCTTTATSTSAPGTYDTVCTGAADPNYGLTSIKGTVTVVPAPLTVTAPSTSITYGAALTPPTPTYSGLRNGDTAPATPATCSTTAPSSPGSGVYPVTCSGAADSHYAIVNQPGTVTVSPASATVAASSETVQYHQGAGTITASYTGLQNGDTALRTPPSCRSTATSSSPVGSYPAVCSGAADPNYVLTYVDGSTR